jgi:hypothetical protein
MRLELITKTSAIKYALVDLLVLGIVGFIPAISHATGIPIYLAEPMRISLFTGYLLVRDKYNLLFLSLLIPQISTIISGHPPFIKSLLISLELLSNVLLFLYLLDYKKYNIFFAFGVSIFASKIFYYTIKFIFLKFNLLKGELFSTSLFSQLIVLIVLSGLMGLIYKKFKV